MAGQGRASETAAARAAVVAGEQAKVVSCFLRLHATSHFEVNMAVKTVNTLMTDALSEVM